MLATREHGLAIADETQVDLHGGRQQVDAHRFDHEVDLCLRIGKRAL